MDLWGKTVNYVLEMLSLKCLWDIQLGFTGKMHIEVLVGDVTRVVAIVIKNQWRCYKGKLDVPSHRTHRMAIIPGVATAF